MEKKRLPWVYCECGCHGHEISIGGLYFWSLTDWPLVKGEPDYENPFFHLNDGHKWGNHLGTFKTYKERDRFIRRIIRKHVNELKKIL